MNSDRTADRSSVNTSAGSTPTIAAATGAGKRRPSTAAASSIATQPVSSRLVRCRIAAVTVAGISVTTERSTVQEPARRTSRPPSTIALSSSSTTNGTPSASRLRRVTTSGGTCAASVPSRAAASSIVWAAVSRPSGTVRAMRRVVAAVTASRAGPGSGRSVASRRTGVPARLSTR